MSEVKVRQIPPKPLKETAKKMRTDNTDGTNEKYHKLQHNFIWKFLFTARF